MDAQVDTKDPAAVEREVQAVYVAMFPQAGGSFVPTALGWLKDCFAGKYRDYQASDARYHDLEHTLQGTLCMARLLHGRHQAGAKPGVNRSEEHTSELQSRLHLVCRLLLEKKKNTNNSDRERSR